MLPPSLPPPLHRRGRLAARASARHGLLGVAFGEKEGGQEQREEEEEDDNIVWRRKAKGGMK